MFFVPKVRQTINTKKFILHVTKVSTYLKYTGSYLILPIGLLKWRISKKKKKKTRYLSYLAILQVQILTYQSTVEYDMSDEVDKLMKLYKYNLLFSCYKSDHGCYIHWPPLYLETLEHFFFKPLKLQSTLLTTSSWTRLPCFITSDTQLARWWCGPISRAPVVTFIRPLDIPDGKLSVRCSFKRGGMSAKLEEVNRDSWTTSVPAAQSHITSCHYRKCRDLHDKRPFWSTQGTSTWTGT